MYTTQSFKTIRIDNRSVSENYAIVLQKELNDAIENLDKNNPEWRDYPVYIEANTDEDDETCISINYTRYFTEQEKKDFERRQESLRQSAISNMEHMIRLYPEEAKEIIKRLV